MEMFVPVLIAAVLYLCAIGLIILWGKWDEIVQIRWQRRLDDSIVDAFCVSHGAEPVSKVRKISWTTEIPTCTDGGKHKFKKIEWTAELTKQHGPDFDPLSENSWYATYRDAYRCQKCASVVVREEIAFI